MYSIKSKFASSCCKFTNFIVYQMFIIYIICTYIVTFGKYLKKIQNAIIVVIPFTGKYVNYSERKGMMKQIESRKIRDKCVFVIPIIEWYRDISTMIVRQWCRIEIKAGGFSLDRNLRYSI